MVTANPAETLKINRQRAQQMAEQAGLKRTRALLERAAKDLVKRLGAKGMLSGAGDEPFSVVQMRVTLAQIKDVLKDLRGGMRTALVQHGRETAETSAQGTLAYLDAMEQRFKGINQVLPIDHARVVDRAVVGAESSILHRIESDPNHPGQPGVLDRYESNVIESFEQEMQLRLVARKPWAEVRQSLVDASPFLQGKPMSWAERILRTESMNASGVASLSTIVQADTELGDMVKILSATFDNRTCADSYAVHGQIRRPNEMFDTWQGQVMNPPARPNDREVVVPHRISWPLPPGLEPKSGGDIASRWAFEGRKGSPPPQPKLSTVDRSLFGKTPPPKIEGEPKPAEAVPEQQPEEQKPVEQMQPKQREPAPELEQQKTKALQLLEADASWSKAKAIPLDAPTINKWEISPFGQPGLLYELHDMAIPKVQTVKLNDITVHSGHDQKGIMAEPPTADVDDVKANITAAEKTMPISVMKYKGELLSANPWGNEQIAAAKYLGKANVEAEITDLDAVVEEKIALAKKKFGDKEDMGLFAKGKSPAPGLHAKMIELSKFGQVASTEEDVEIEKINFAFPLKFENLSGALKDFGEKALPPVVKMHGQYYASASAPDIAAQHVVMGGSTVKVKVIDVAAPAIEASNAATAAAAATKKLGTELLANVEETRKVAHDKSLPVREKLQRLPKYELPSDASSVSDRYAFNRELENDYDAKKLPKQARTSITRFSSGYDWLIREVARGGDKEATMQKEMDHRGIGRAEAEKRFGEAVKFNKGIEGSFKKLTPRPMVVYRGIGNLTDEVFNSIVESEDIEFDAPSSTSWRAGVAMNFMKGGNQVFFRFKQKSGIGMEPLSEYKSENEILMKKGAKFKVTGRAHANERTLIIDAEEV